MKYPEIQVTQDDLKKIIYFILMKFKGDPMHRQGTSSKRDFIGGYIERWFNKIAETVVFDFLLKDKNYQVVCDYFIYANDSDKNAPDILGLKKNGGVIPFARYNNGTWNSVQNMPQVEVKVVRNDQYMVGVREQQMNDDYYAFIESNLDGDYLSSILDKSVFDDKYLEELSMSPAFVESDRDNQIIHPAKVSPAKNIGTMRLMGIYKNQEVRENSVLCGAKVSPYYFSSASNVSPKTHARLNERPTIDSDGRFAYNLSGPNIYLPVSFDVPEHTEIILIKKNKGSVYLNSSRNINIGGVDLNAGDIKLDFKKFERTSQWSEHVLLKQTIEKYGEDSTEELVSLFDSMVAGG